jgi:hypothetical protein
LIRYNGYRFFFFQEEPRMYVHVYHADGEAKFWLEPIVSLATSTGLSAKQLKELHKVIEERKDDIEKLWKKHFGS